MSNPFIIGEIGINANGDINLAKQLIRMAKLCEVDAVKFQKRTIDLAYTQEFLSQPRQSPWGTTQREQKEALEFDKTEYDEIDAYCKKVGIPWFASAWDYQAQEFLSRYHCPYNKVASPMATNYVHLQLVAEEQKPTFLSTARLDAEALDAVVDMYASYKTPLTLMHCTLKYPCPDEACNLKMIPELIKRYRLPVGYSTHNPSILPCALAVSLGAEALEMHITLDRTMYGSDQPASHEMMTLLYIVRDSKRVGRIIG